MNYKGTIIQESLGDQSVLRDITILATRVEEVTEKHQTPWLKQWTLHTVEIPEEKADEFAQKISTSFDPKHPNWYVDFKNNIYHFIIFPNKIFKVDVASPILYKETKSYGMSLGIPDYQLNFAP